MTDLRTLCAELADELEDWVAFGDEADCADAHALVDRARAALAQPEPQGPGPTDEELLGIEDLEAAWNAQADAFNSWDELGIDEIVCWAQQQALARWGRPAKPEVQDQVLAHVEFAEREFNCPSDVVLRQYCDDWFYGDPERSEVDPVDLCRGAIKLFAQIPAPVPVSEGLPGPEDCNAEGCCWAIGERGDWMCVHVLGRSWSNPVYTHWLPHWALPVPKSNSITQGE